MSFKYAHAGVYYCDGLGCKTKVFVADGMMPPGWVKTEWQDLDGWRTSHYCPEHIPKSKGGA